MSPPFTECRWLNDTCVYKINGYCVYLKQKFYVCYTSFKILTFYQVFANICVYLFNWSSSLAKRSYVLSIDRLVALGESVLLCVLKLSQSFRQGSKLRERYSFLRLPKINIHAHKTPKIKRTIKQCDCVATYKAFVPSSQLWSHSQM